MPEITLQQTGADDIKELVPMTNMIDEMLPGADNKLRTKLRIKIYNLSRTRNWPWVTVKRRRYYKPETAKIIIGSVNDYAEAIKSEAAQNKKASQKKKAAPKPKTKVKKAKPVDTANILAQATKKAKLDDEMKQKLEKRVAYIAKIDLLKPVKGTTDYSAEDAKQIVPELANYYQQLQHDIHLTKTENNKSRNNGNRQKERNNREQNRENNNVNTKHPFEIKNNRNNYRRNYNNRRQNYNQNYNQRSDYSNLQERYDNLLRNYTQLEERYDKVLNEKNNLINEKANQLDTRFNNLKSILLEVLKRS